MTVCFLCNAADKKMSLEHSIPQFLYGAMSDEKFKKQMLCADCNSALGLWVDARFARSFLVHTELDILKPEVFQSLSTINLDEHIELANLLERGKTIETYFSTLCTIYWVKGNTKEFTKLIGGQPIRSKNNSEMFVYINDNANASDKKILMNIIGLIRQQFKKFKKINILLCIDFILKYENNIDISINDKNKNLIRKELLGDYANDSNIKLSFEFEQREKDIRKEIALIAKQELSSCIELNLNDNTRFLSKLFLGIMVGFLGNKFESTEAGINLIRIIKSYKNLSVLEDGDIRRQIFSLGIQEKAREIVYKLFDCDKKINIAIGNFFNIDKIYGFLSINKIFFALELCDFNELLAEDLEKLNLVEHCISGVVLVYSPESNKYIEEPFMEYLIERVYQ